MKNYSYNIPISVKGVVTEGDKVWLRKNERNEWELPGGKLEKNEQPEQTVIRELKEELGFEVSIIRLIDATVLNIKNSQNENNGVLILSYFCKIISKTGEFEIQSEGGKAEFNKFNINELKNLNMPLCYKQTIYKILKINL